MSMINITASHNEYTTQMQNVYSKGDCAYRGKKAYRRTYTFSLLSFLLIIPEYVCEWQELTHASVHVWRSQDNPDVGTKLRSSGLCSHELLPAASILLALGSTFITQKLNTRKKAREVGRKVGRERNQLSHNNLGKRQ